ncbi:MAG: hypothetical protein HY695_17290 [Deltaproteobacteria bacterium]|nr:hypothetical protein [Deltaproteobacteria bacterium]
MRRVWQKVTGWASSNIGLRLFSLIFAAGLWFFVNAGQKAAERAIEVPVEFRNIPSEMMVMDSSLGQVELRVMGPPALLSTLNPENLKVALDLEGSRPGTSSFRLNPDFFNPPRGIRVTRISPSVINVRLEPVAVRSLPVSVRLAGKPLLGNRVARVEVTPETVKVRGPANELNKMASVETQPVALDGRGPMTQEVRLNSAGKGLSFSPDRVTVSVTLEEELVTKEFSRVEVTTKDFSGVVRVTPRRVYLRLSGPRRILEGLKIGSDQAYLDVRGLGPGTHVLALTFNFPPEIRVVEQKPDRFQVKIIQAG